jgi:hypothetical protein
MWDLTDHACRHCHGRLLSGVDTLGLPVFRCAQCGAMHAQPDEKSKAKLGPLARTVEELCCCGMRVGARQTMRCERLPSMAEGSGMPEVGVRQRDVRVKSEPRMPRYAVGGD